MGRVVVTSSAAPGMQTARAALATARAEVEKGAALLPEQRRFHAEAEREARERHEAALRELDRAVQALPPTNWPLTNDAPRPAVTTFPPGPRMPAMAPTWPVPPTP